MVIGVQMMSSCESDGKRLEQPGGAPPKEGSNQARNQKIEKSPDPLDPETSQILVARLFLKKNPQNTNFITTMIKIRPTTTLTTASKTRIQP